MKGILNEDMISAAATVAQSLAVIRDVLLEIHTAAEDPVKVREMAATGLDEVEAAHRAINLEGGRG